MEQPGLELVPTWDAGVTGGGFTHSATAPPLACIILAKDCLVFLFFFERQSDREREEKAERESHHQLSTPQRPATAKARRSLEPHPGLCGWQGSTAPQGALAGGWGRQRGGLHLRAPVWEPGLRCRLSPPCHSTHPCGGLGLSQTLSLRRGSWSQSGDGAASGTVVPS